MRIAITNLAKFYVYVTSALCTLWLVVMIASTAGAPGLVGQSELDRNLGGVVIRAMRDPEIPQLMHVHEVVNALNYSIRHGQAIDHKLADRIWIGAMQFVSRDGIYIYQELGSKYYIVVAPIFLGKSISKFEWREMEAERL